MSNESNNKERNKIIKSYLDLTFPGAFGGINRFYKQYKKRNPESPVNFETTKSAIESIPSYQLHVTKRKRFQRRKYTLPSGSLSKRII